MLIPFVWILLLISCSPVICKSVPCFPDYANASSYVNVNTYHQNGYTWYDGASIDPIKMAVVLMLYEYINRYIDQILLKICIICILQTFMKIW